MPSGRFKNLTPVIVAIFYPPQAGARQRAQKHPPCITFFLANLYIRNWREQIIYQQTTFSHPSIQILLFSPYIDLFLRPLGFFAVVTVLRGLLLLGDFAPFFRVGVPPLKRRDPDIFRRDTIIYNVSLLSRAFYDALFFFSR